MSSPVIAGCQQEEGAENLMSRDRDSAWGLCLNRGHNYFFLQIFLDVKLQTIMFIKELPI